MNEQSVLIVDDEPDIRELLHITLSRMGLDTHGAATLNEALTLVDEIKPDLCLTDMKLPDGNGISLVEYIQAEYPNMPVAMITAHGSVETAITALKAGAFDFISKPIELGGLRNLVSSALQLESGGSEQYSPAEQDLIGEAPAIMELRRQVSKVARSQAPVHIHGESGSGKEVVARLIHNMGPRASGSFIAVNCGAIPPDLMESELFGHKRGSFTGASHDKIGLFQAASGGTLFLDEVADLPLNMQVKLLRAIQEKAIRPIGAAEEQGIDVRLLSATHKNLTQEVEAGRFRGDLYYRINVIDLHVPSLRDRKSDLPLLVTHILTRLGKTVGDIEIEASAIESLQLYNFPGNVRELENMLERAVALSDGVAITTKDLQFTNTAPRSPYARERASDGEQGLRAPIQLSTVYGNFEGFLEDLERDILIAALEESAGNKTKTAKNLGISFRSLRYRLKKLNIGD